MSDLRVLIADDEPPARAKLRLFLGESPGVAVVGEACDGPAAVAAVRELRPDLVFLDIRMPGLDGFEVLRELGEDALPHVVFVTAFDEYAVRAFDVHAVDYLLKPFDEERFHTALERARARLRPGAPQDDLAERVRAALADVRRPEPFTERMLVRTGGRARLIAVADIDFVEAEENYVRLHTGGTSYLVRESLSAVEARLDPSRFARVHRSHLVNLGSVREMYPWSHGDWMIVLHDGREVPFSRRYRDRRPDLAG